MEPVFQAHPIPQNVTNFEFHLVGDMTLKQFGYLAAGLGLAFLVFTTLSTVQPIIAWPIIIISSILGVAFAFLPIQERPLDHWVGAFFKAIFKPTSLKYSSKIINPEDPLFNRRLGHYIRTYKYNQAKHNAPLGNPNLLPSALSDRVPQSTIRQAVAPAIAAAPAQKKQNFIDKFKAGQTSFTAPQPHPTQSLPPKQQPAPQAASQPLSPINSGPILATPQKPPAPAQATIPFSPTPSNLSPVPSSSSPTPGILRNPEVISKLPQASQMLPNQPQPAPAPMEAEEVLNPEQLKKTVELANEAQKTQQEIVKIETSLSQLKQQAAQPGVDPKSYIEQFEDLLTQLQKLNEKASKTAQSLAQISQTGPSPLQPVESIVLNAPTPKAKSIPTLKLTSFPNVINGIITDSEGNYLEGAIIVAHDKQGLPVRALKSNKLGQFVAATPLPNGDYSIVVEKEHLSFDKSALTLTNEILPPILVAAKKIQPVTAV